MNKNTLIILSALAIAITLAGCNSKTNSNINADSQTSVKSENLKASPNTTPLEKEVKSIQAPTPYISVETDLTQAELDSLNGSGLSEEEWRKKVRSGEIIIGADTPMFTPVPIENVYQKKCIKIVYNDLITTPKRYFQKDITISGKIISSNYQLTGDLRAILISDDNNLNTIDISQSTNNKNFSNGKIKEGDVITIWGKLITFKPKGESSITTNDSDKNIAFIDVKYIRK